MKNKTQLDGMPVWFDGKSINEALFCEEFLQTHKIIFTNGALVATPLRFVFKTVSIALNDFSVLVSSLIISSSSRKSSLQNFADVFE